MHGPEQQELDFGAPAEDGYALWAWDRREALRRIGAAWSLPLGARVRAKLWNLDQEFVGRLVLVRRPERLDPREPLALRIDTMPFLSTDIERCTVLAEEVGGA